MIDWSGEPGRETPTDWAAVKAQVDFAAALPRPDLPPCPSWCSTQPHDTGHPAAGIDVATHTIRRVHQAEFLHRPYPELDPGSLDVAVSAYEHHDLTTGEGIARDAPGLSLFVGVPFVVLTATDARQLASELAYALTAPASLHRTYTDPGGGDPRAGRWEPYDVDLDVIATADHVALAVGDAAVQLTHTAGRELAEHLAAALTCAADAFDAATEWAET